MSVDRTGASFDSDEIWMKSVRGRVARDCPRDSTASELDTQSQVARLELAPERGSLGSRLKAVHRPEKLDDRSWCKRSMEGEEGDRPGTLLKGRGLGRALLAEMDCIPNMFSSNSRLAAS